MIRIQTLGGFTVRAEDGKPAAGSAAQPRRMAILALLARAGERGISREKVLNLLWPDADDERGPRTLAQAFYSLRKDLGAEEAISGSKELRLNPALVFCDVMEFSAAVARGDNERAAALYEGPFLDGFRLPGADEFARWLDTERASLANDYARALELLARAAHDQQRAADAVMWWRKLAALEPLNARVTVELMEAMAAAGDRAGAIRYAHVYELLVQEELDLPPDAEVIALTERLRKQSEVLPARPVAEPQKINAPVLNPTTPAAVTAEVQAEPARTADSHDEQKPVVSALEVVQVAPRNTWRRPSWTLAGAGVLAMVGLLAVLLRGPLLRRSSADSGTVVAMGRIASYGSDSSTVALTGAVSDLLATSLARLQGLRLVSQSRMLELMPSADTSAAARVNAARQAGATDVIDGILYARPGGLLRLDLRRVDLATGAIRDVHTVEGRDLFALVDSGTAQLGGALGRSAPRGSVSDVTTHSVTAYRTYAQGLRAYYAFDHRSALSLFDDALAEDSLFALAAYYGALAALEAAPDSYHARLERAKRLAAHAPDRERLIITADWAMRSSSPTMRAVAETLAARYPSDVEGHLYSGMALVNDGDFVAATRPLERVLALDSLALRRTGANCAPCEALPWLVSAYELMDSSAAAERTARRWVRLQPGSWLPTELLIAVLANHGRVQTADSILRAVPIDAPYDRTITYRVIFFLRTGNYREADRLLREEFRRAGPQQKMDAYWWMAISLRQQGRLAAALDTARELRRFAEPTPTGGRKTQSLSVLEAQLQLELGHPVQSAALFDSIAHMDLTGLTPSEARRHVAFVLTHAADAQAAAGDTVRLARTADTVYAAGQASGFGRDRRLYHHVRGLLLAAHGRDADAINEFQAAIYSTTGGYTRTNYELARLYLRNQRARAAVAVLQPALRGGIESSNLYVSRTELHELLAKAWNAAGVQDSARAHYTEVAKAWSAGDAPFRLRADSARVRAAQLAAQSR